MTTHRIHTLRFNGAGPPVPGEEQITGEAPLQIRVNLRPFTTTMRTPGDDRALARGLLFTEGVVPDPRVLVTWREERDPSSGSILAIDARAPEAFVQKHRLDRRSLIATASCGLCGTVDARDVAIIGPPLNRRADERLDARLIAPMVAAMRAEQRDYDDTGGCHAAAAFTLGGMALAVCEDVGRHNAVDKVIGRLIEAGQLNGTKIERNIAAEDSASHTRIVINDKDFATGDSASHTQNIINMNQDHGDVIEVKSEIRNPKSEIPQVLLVSGRVSFEIVSKAYRAGLPFVLGVSATTSMAASEAARLGITLLAFCRDDRATVYAGGEYLR